MSTVSGLSPRDPLVEPRFGDVFRHGSSARAGKVLYLRSLGPVMDDDWLGLALDSEFEFDHGVQQWVKLRDKTWEFVETIAVHATGNAMGALDFSSSIRALYGFKSALVKIKGIDLGSGS